MSLTHWIAIQGEQTHSLSVVHCSKPSTKNFLLPVNTMARHPLRWKHHYRIAIWAHLMCYIKWHLAKKCFTSKTCPYGQSCHISQCENYTDENPPNYFSISLMTGHGIWLHDACVISFVFWSRWTLHQVTQKRYVSKHWHLTNHILTDSLNQDGLFAIPVGYWHWCSVINDISKYWISVLSLR